MTPFKDRDGQLAVQDIDGGELREGKPRGAASYHRASFLAERQRAEVSLMVTKDAGFNARAEITNGGLLSIAVLVSSILVSTAVLVHVAVRESKRRPR